MQYITSNIQIVPDLRLEIHIQCMQLNTISHATILSLFIYFIKTIEFVFCCCYFIGMRMPVLCDVVIFSSVSFRFPF